MEKNGIIEEREKDIALHCIELARKAGADSVRVSLSKTISNGINILDGEIDRSLFSEERSIMLHIFANGRFGAYSTNLLDEAGLKTFIGNAVDMTRLLEEDRCRRLPDKSLKAESCTGGDESGLYDRRYPAAGIEEKTARALEICNRKGENGAGWVLESSEEEYSDSLDDNYIVDSDGFEGRHIETSYAYCAEATIRDSRGLRHSGYWWDASPFASQYDFSGIGRTAIEKAAMQLGPRPIPSGRYTIIVDRSCASRLVAPLLQALDAMNIQQGNSFLAGKKGERLFPEFFTLDDRPLEAGRPGSRMFDTETLATKNLDLIKEGRVQEYLVNTYIANKTGLKPTTGEISRPCIRPHICNCSKKEINLKDICLSVSDALYITGFNGGNCNPATGNFSFGVEGLLVRKGETEHPVKEVLMTGDMTTLWKNLIAAGSDPRECCRWQIPTLAFKDVIINA